MEDNKKSTTKDRRVVAYLTPMYHNKYLNFIKENGSRKCEATREIIEQFFDQREKAKIK
jgi:hypothetical protein